MTESIDQKVARQIEQLRQECYEKGYADADAKAALRSDLAAIEASQVQSIGDVHSCSFFCGLPACIKRQRDELRDKYVKAIP